MNDKEKKIERLMKMGWSRAKIAKYLGERKGFKKDKRYLLPELNKLKGRDKTALGVKPTFQKHREIQQILFHLNNNVDLSTELCFEGCAGVGHATKVYQKYFERVIAYEIDIRTHKGLVESVSAFDNVETHLGDCWRGLTNLDHAFFIDLDLNFDLGKKYAQRAINKSNMLVFFIGMAFMGVRGGHGMHIEKNWGVKLDPSTSHTAHIIINALDFSNKDHHITDYGAKFHRVWVYDKELSDYLPKNWLKKRRQ